MVEARVIEHEREVYKWQKAYENKDKCTAIDAFDQIVVLGLNPSKGFVCPLIKDSSNGQQVSLQREFFRLLLKNPTSIIHIIMFK